MIRIFEGEGAFSEARREAPRGLSEEILTRVRALLERVRGEGDAALVDLAEKLDGVEMKREDLRVSPELISGKAAEVPSSLRAVLEHAADNIRAFHQVQKEKSWKLEHEDGAMVGQKVVPLDTVGIYVPGGKAAYPSSLLMNTIPARIAGVRRIVVCTPPGTLERTPALAAAFRLVGLSEVYRVGGAQAVAAMAYGTETVARVDKIVGPGNVYVAAAKKLVFGDVGIDSIAGPSEIVVMADEHADARYVAADLLSQAEHGSGDERAILVTCSRDLAERVVRELSLQMAGLPRSEEIREVLERHGAAVVVPSMDAAVALVDRIAPEHLEILAEDEETLAERVRNAGAIFIGAHSPVPVGDFYAGPNHVLPTGGTARFASPLGVYDFVKRSSLVRYTRERLARDRTDIETFARTEGFEAHARAVSVRFSK